MKRHYTYINDCSNEIIENLISNLDYDLERIPEVMENSVKFLAQKDINILKSFRLGSWFCGLMSNAMIAICLQKEAYAYTFLFYAKQLLHLDYQARELTSSPVESDGNIAYSVYATLILRDKQTQTLYSQVKLVLHENTYYSFRLAYVYVDMLRVLCSGNDAKILEAIDFFLLFQAREREKETPVKQNKANNIYKNFDEYYEDDLTTPYSTGTPSYYGEGDETEMLKVPFVLVLKSIFEQDEQGFNQNLLIALEKHYDFYENYQRVSGESLRDLPEGWISLPLTVACAIAHDKGMKREVESDYITEWIVKGEFEGLELVVE